MGHVSKGLELNRILAGRQKGLRPGSRVFVMLVVPTVELTFEPTHRNNTKKMFWVEPVSRPFLAFNYN